MKWLSILQDCFSSSMPLCLQRRLASQFHQLLWRFIVHQAQFEIGASTGWNSFPWTCKVIIVLPRSPSFLSCCCYKKNPWIFNFRNEVIYIYIYSLSTDIVFTPTPIKETGASIYIVYLIIYIYKTFILFELVLFYNIQNKIFQIKNHRICKS